MEWEGERNEVGGMDGGTSGVMRMTSKEELTGKEKGRAGRHPEALKRQKERKGGGKRG